MNNGSGLAIPFQQAPWSSKLQLNSLVSSPWDYPIRCRAVHGMAFTDGKKLIVDFKKGGRPTDQLLPGQCSWLDRGLGANQPTRIADGRPSADEARLSLLFPKPRSSRHSGRSALYQG
ncbi:MAG TPA: hypothetical protein VMU26_05775 [Candidatus Polarisedimenticolia bacterium]|nr:hypothetical protein [Candidatus Polarisedimenticolia bacterium]